MIANTAPADTADSLMERALALLDCQGGEEATACLLQHALDTLRRVPAMQAGDELDPALLAKFGLLDAAPLRSEHIVDRQRHTDHDR